MIDPQLLRLLALNALFLASGSGILWGIRGWSARRDWLALSGIAYVLGLGTATLVTTVVLVLGGGASLAEILLATLGPGGGGVLHGVLRHRPRPRSLRQRPEPLRFGRVVTAGLAAVTGFVLLAFAPEARLQPLTEWDAWTFWIPKAKVIYLFGGIDNPLFASLQGPSYPLFVPALDAMDFRFMGGPNTILLGLQQWLLLAGFVFAMAGLLRSLAAPFLTWLFALTVVVMPGLDDSLLSRVGDWPLDIFFVLAALALARWILTGERWSLVFFGVVLAAALATKREGQVLAACLVVGGIAALGWRRRRSWPFLLGTAALAYAVNVPWRLWWTSRHLTPDTPPGGVIAATLHLGRVRASFELVLRLLFDVHLWGLAVPVALGAALVLLTLARRTSAVLYLVTTVLAVVGWAWVNWSDPTLPLTTDGALNPTIRAVGSLTLLSAAFAPLLLTPVLERVPEPVVSVVRAERGRARTEPSPDSVRAPRTS